ncbi:aconitase X [Sporobacter termitidis]|nr:aconitase X [Sporobacter termitidis]
MVFLKDEEKRILQGEEGHVAQLCMEFIVETANVAGAEKLVDLDGTGDFHTPRTAMVPFYEFPFEELKALAESGATFKIPTFANKSPFGELTPVQGWEHCHMCTYGTNCHDDPEFHKKAMHDDYYALYRKMGMMTTHSCASYLTATYLPTMGQHCSWNESSAVPYCNAVLGARTNIDGSFATCFLGKAAYYDMHVTENRHATILVKTERRIQSDLEWDVFGFAVGEECGVAIPCLTGTAKPNTTQFMKLNSGMNTGGNVRMYHIPGSTPEAHTVEMAFGGKKPRRETMIGEAELKRAYETLNYHTADTVDLVYLGCPHLNIVDLMLLARKLEGKKCKVPLWIMSTPWLYSVAKDLGYVKTFKDAGAYLMTGTCLAAMGGVPEGVKNLAVDSAKQSYYITGCYPNDPLGVCYGSQDDCIDAAVTGRWHGEWK